MEFSLTGEGDLDLDGEWRDRVVGRLIRRVGEEYILVDLATRMVEDLQRRHKAGEYDGCATASALSAALQGHMQEISRDKHLRVRYVPGGEDEPDPDAPEPEGSRRERLLDGEADNFGFHRVERLPGNVGYLDVRLLNAVDITAETAVAAMNFLAHTYALIIDLRRNRGGDPETVALITSYLFNSRTHLNSLESRGEGAQSSQYWTQSYVPGRRYGEEKPVYVLLSSLTFSGAEEFAYNLKNLKRATLIGETTRGGAHPVALLWLDRHFRVTMPVARAVNPISGTNWEGTGVAPDIDVPEDEAFRRAYHLAADHVLDLELPDLSPPARKRLRDEIEEAFSDSLDRP
jgi:retinol-binding protein 3